MKPGQYKLRDLFDNQEITHILIPELQRDYVWNKEQLINSLDNGLLQTLQVSFDKYQNQYQIIEESKISIEDTSNSDYNEDFRFYINTEFKRLYKEVKLSDSIGFLYAYYDTSYPDKFFLIDGQQRFTTLYLTLLALTSFDTSLKVEFETLCLDKEDKPKLCYKVRRKTEDFLNHFTSWILNQNANVIKCKTVEDFKKLLNQNFWYNNENKNDVTISSFINNFFNITIYLEKNINNKKSFWLYLLDYVCFWYFDTSISEQGEQLFISMNSRGMSSSTQELDKANLLKNITSKKDKIIWGENWEVWQQFFWEMRNLDENNSNADRGLNLFLRVIRDIENNHEGEQFLHIIKEYYNGINILNSNLNIISNFDNTDSKRFWKEFLSGFNYSEDKNYNREIDVKQNDSDEDNSQRKSFTNMFGSLAKRLYAYSILYYCKTFHDNFNQEDFIRFMRISRNLLINSDIKYKQYTDILNNLKQFISTLQNDVLCQVQIFNDFSPLNGSQIAEEKEKARIKTKFENTETILNQIEDFEGAQGRARHLYRLFDGNNRTKSNLEIGFEKFKIFAFVGDLVIQYRDTDILELYIVNEENENRKMFLHKHNERMKFNNKNEEAFELWKSKLFQSLVKDAIDNNIENDSKNTYLDKLINNTLLQIFQSENVDSKDKIPSIVKLHYQYFLYYILYRKIYNLKCDINCPLHIGKTTIYKEDYVKNKKRLFSDKGVIEFFKNKYYGYKIEYVLPVHSMKNKEYKEQWIDKLWDYYINLKSQATN